MDENNISSESVTLVTTAPEAGEPQAWWQAPINDNPWWYETPTLMQPLQQQAWYLPEVKAPELEYLRTTRPVITVGPVLIAAGILAAVAAISALADW